MPVWKFPQIYVDFVAEVETASFGWTGIAAYGIEKPVYVEATLPSLDCESLTGSILEATFPEFSFEANCVESRSLTAEITFPSLDVNAVSGAIVESEFPRLVVEARALTAISCSCEVQLPCFGVEVDAEAEKVVEGSFAFPAINLEATTGSAAEVNFPLFSIESRVSSESLTTASIEFPKLRLESNTLIGSVIDSEITFPSFRSEVYTGSIAEASLSKFSVECDFKHSVDTSIQAFIPSLRLESNVYDMTPKSEVETELPPLSLIAFASKTQNECEVISFEKQLRIFTEAEVSPLSVEAEGTVL